LTSSNGSWDPIQLENRGKLQIFADPEFLGNDGVGQRVLETHPILKQLRILYDHHKIRLFDRPFFKSQFFLSNPDNKRPALTAIWASP
jgi:hypothetical protein